MQVPRPRPDHLFEFVSDCCHLFCLALESMLVLINDEACAPFPQPLHIIIGAVFAATSVLGSVLKAIIWIQEDQLALPDLLHRRVQPRVIWPRWFALDRRFTKELCPFGPDWDMLNCGRSEERRVGKECRSRRSPEREKRKER